MMSCEFYKDGVTWAARAIARGLRQWRAQLAQRQRKLHQPHKKEQLEGAACRGGCPLTVMAKGGEPCEALRAGSMLLYCWRP